jgi:hypothetical protein
MIISLAKLCTLACASYAAAVKLASSGGIAISPSALCAGTAAAILSNAACGARVWRKQ